jgi:hypothetical protein
MTATYRNVALIIYFRLATSVSGGRRDGLPSILRTMSRVAPYLCSEYGQSAVIEYARELELLQHCNMQELITCRQLACLPLHARVVGTLCLGCVSECRWRWWGSVGHRLGETRRMITAFVACPEE